MKSETITGRPSTVRTSWTQTIPGWRNWAAARASRWKRSNSSSAVRRPECGIFSATTRSSVASRAFQTAPKPPTPTRSSSWNLPSGRIGAALCVCLASRSRKLLPQAGHSTSSAWSSANWIGL